MHQTSSLARACFASKATFVLLLLLFPTSGALAEGNRCDLRLGRNYDQQTAEVKMARLVLYLDCRYLQDFQFMQSKLKDMLLGIRKWKNRANRVIHSRLAVKRTIAMAEQKTMHATEQGDLEANFRNQYAEVELAPATDNGLVSDKKRKITRAFRTDRRAMWSHHRKEVSLLKKMFGQCSVAVNNEISEMFIGDTGNVLLQHLDNSAWLKREYEDIKMAPMSMSPNDYAASQPSVPPPTGSMSNEDPIGSIQAVEGSGSGTVTRPSGETVEASPRTSIYQGDIVEMGEGSLCEIVFADKTTIVVDEESRLEIDEDVYDPDSDDGERGFSFLRGVFVFTSGLIGRKEPSDVAIGNIGGSVGTRG